MKKEDYIHSSPYFFKRIGIAAAIVVVFLFVGAFFSTAPLQEAAEPFNVPNPSKSAWFLLWTQELVAYHTGFIYLIVGLFVVFLALPFVIKGKPQQASWFQKKYLLLNIFILIIFFGIVFLTITAVFFRGEYWRLTF